MGVLGLARGAGCPWSGLASRSRGPAHRPALWGNGARSTWQLLPAPPSSASLDTPTWGGEPWHPQPLSLFHGKEEGGERKAVLIKE